MAVKQAAADRHKCTLFELLTCPHKVEKCLTSNDEFPYPDINQEKDINGKYVGALSIESNCPRQKSMPHS